MREKFEVRRNFSIVFMIIGGIMMIMGLGSILSSLNNQLIFLTVGGSFVCGLGLVGFAYYRWKIKDLISFITNLPESTIPNSGNSDEIIQQTEIATYEEKRTRRKSKQQYKLIIFKKLAKNTKCEISKTTLDESDRIIQCLNCKSCFLESYFLKWLEEKKFCPVCKFIFKE
jgi:hypothetical protein